MSGKRNTRKDRGEMEIKENEIKNRYIDLWNASKIRR